MMTMATMTLLHKRHDADQDMFGIVWALFGVHGSNLMVWDMQKRTEGGATQCGEARRAREREDTVVWEWFGNTCTGTVYGHDIVSAWIYTQA
jgi:hypothetical protein